MAYCKVGASHNSFATIRYCEEKEGVLARGVDCDIDNVKYEMQSLRRAYNKDTGVQCHTVIQSFKGQECSQEKANELGQELAKRLAPGYQAAVYTHIDSDGGNIHNHIIINSVSYETGRKLESGNLLQESRAISNELSRENGLSVIESRDAHLRYTQTEQALAKKGQQPWKDEIREVVDQAKLKSRDMGEFRANLEEYGVKMNERGKERKITYEHPNGMKVRSAKLGADYERPALEKSFGRVQEQDIGVRQVELKKGFDPEKEHESRMNAVTAPPPPDPVERTRVQVQSRKKAKTKQKAAPVVERDTGWGMSR